ncbi:MAG: hypothetical protein LC116_03980 [Bacteroidetes bacterium]|nr:hypothetical protein [Bacteroidota bacterium]
MIHPFLYLFATANSKSYLPLFSVQTSAIYAPAASPAVENTSPAVAACAKNIERALDAS